MNYFVSLDKNADNKITFTEFFGNLNALLSKVETGISSGDCGGNAKFNLLEFILEQLKKLQEELQEALQESNDELKQRAIQKGLQALSEAELELFKSQNPLDYERLKAEQENAPNLEHSPPNLPENSAQTNDEILSSFSQTNENSLSNALLALEKAMSADLLAQIKGQSLAIIDLKA